MESDSSSEARNKSLPRGWRSRAGSRSGGAMPRARARARGLQGSRPRRDFFNAKKEMTMNLFAGDLVRGAKRTRARAG